MKKQVFNSPADLNVAAAEAWIKDSHQAIENKGAFHVALSGGSSPKQLFELLASKSYSNRNDWVHTHIYFGDERSVAPTHDDSNYKMAKTALLNHVNIPEEQIHRFKTEMPDIHAVASDYESTLRATLPLDSQNLPVFDLVLLGMGPDGHTASLFPGTTALKEQNKQVAATFVEKMDTWRVTLTYPVLNNAAHVLFLVPGEAKSPVIKEIFTTATKHYPIEFVDTPNGEWFLDAASASQL